MPERSETTYFFNYDDSFFVLEKERAEAKAAAREKAAENTGKEPLKQDGQKVIPKQSRRIQRKPGKSNIKSRFEKPLWMKRLEQKQRKIDATLNFKANPLPLRDFFDSIAVLFNSLQLSDEEGWKYLEVRWREFCIDAIRSLDLNLQPGEMKWGYRLELGRFSFAVIDRIFCQNTPCIKTQIDEILTVGGMDVPCRLFKYSFLLESGFPKFNTEKEWWKMLTLPSKGYNILSESKYTALSITVNDYDSRVYCGWEMETWKHVVIPSQTEGSWMLGC